MSKVVKLQKEPLTRRAVQAIRDAIFAGEFGPGQRLVEEELSESLGVSRNVVREAFWQLEAQGLLQNDDYKGKSVTSVTVNDMAELIPLRLTMESLAATWAARNVTPEAARTLRQAAANFLKMGPDVGFASYAKTDFELHQSIWRLAGNKQMALMLDRVACPMIALQVRIYQPILADLVRKEAEKSDGSHHGIVEAICTGDPDLARTAMQKHVLAFWKMWLTQASETAPGSHQAIEDAIGLVSHSLEFSGVR